jgi:transcriptional regulator with XRE-family HTH domain
LLGEVERGNRNPSEAFLLEVAEILHISIEELQPPEDK